jgi:ferredoxin
MAFGEDGKLHFDAIEGSEQVLPADTVILAIGQEPDLSFLPEDIEVQGGIINIDEDGVTSRPKYFAGGDAAFSEGKVAWAIGSGRRAAEAIHRSFRGLPDREPTDRPSMTQSRLPDTDFFEDKERPKEPVLPVKERLGNFSEVQLGLDPEQVKAEADRCLLCEGMCRVACPYDAPQFGAEENPKMQKCDFCLEEWQQGKQPICVRSCTMRALDAGPMEELVAKYGDMRKAEGFQYYEKSDPAIVFKPKFHG